MVTITRQQAICMFYCEEYTKENVIKLNKRIAEMEDVEICFMNDPLSPLLQCEKRINQNPFLYNRYPVGETKSDDKSNTSGAMLRKLVATKKNQAQIIQFLNIIYFASDPGNGVMFDCKEITTKEILNTVKQYTTFFDDKTIFSFGQWCSRKKVELVTVGSKRVSRNGERINIRSLYALKDEYLGESRQIFIPHFLKNEGFSIIGYARKSPGKDNEANRVRCLRSMCDRLVERSLVDVVFISSCCKAADPLAERDRTKNCDILSTLNVAGDMQDLLLFIAEKPKICLVVLDFAGLTTNILDLNEFLKNNEQIKKIMVDMLPISNKVHVYDRSELVENQEKLTLFDCRKRSYQRSLE
ncbi:hypothetical protein INT45_008385 [Circinella minor]|uniref:Uncharacterized protein n=1 Tax=Circinella minor TaxID=1195481 RepID=A0A8H7VDD4_9FUNG|nr:hypothetical protein INT45_008385 [Circinella minor]